MQSRIPSGARPSLLGMFWLGIQVVWGALLGISLQARSIQLAGHNALAAYGTLAATGAAVAAITQIAVGILSDRRRYRGSRRIEFYATGAVAACAALFWFYGAPTFPQLVASVVVLQIAMNVATGPYQAVIPDFVSEEALGTASSWMAALQSIGNALGAVIAGLVRDARVTAAAISALLLATCAATALHVRTLRPLPAREERLSITKAFVDLFISRGLLYLGFYTLLGYLFFYIGATLGGDVKMLTGYVVLVFTAAGAIGAAAGAAPSNRFDRRGVATTAGAAFIASLFAFLISHSAPAIFISATLAGASWGAFLTADWALGCQFMPRSSLATAMGIWNLALLLPQVLAPLAATALLSGLHALQQSSAPRIAFVLAAVEVGAGIAWIWRLPPARALAVDSAFGGNTP